jgi:hypothetical protein
VTFLLTHDAGAHVGSGCTVAGRHPTMTRGAHPHQLWGAIGQELGIGSTVGGVLDVMHLGAGDDADTGDGELTGRVAAQHTLPQPLGQTTGTVAGALSAITCPRHGEPIWPIHISWCPCFYMLGSTTNADPQSGGRYSNGTFQNGTVTTEPASSASSRCRGRRIVPTKPNRR